VSSVLDASALMAALNGEPGGDNVQEVMTTGAVISAVNFAEVVTKLVERGLDLEAVHAALDVIPLEVVPFDEEQAYRAGLLRAATRRAGLSLGDRACLALAAQLGLPAMTADRAWATLSLDAQFGIQIDVIR
jgi:ribonuclease VapC